MNQHPQIKIKFKAKDGRNYAVAQCNGLDVVYYLSLSQGLWRICLREHFHAILYKGRDYTNTTMVHPLLQSLFYKFPLTAFDSTQLQEQEKEAKQLSVDNYKNLNAYVDSDKRISKFLPFEMFSHFGDLPLEDVETFTIQYSRYKNSGVKNPSDLQFRNYFDAFCEKIMKEDPKGCLSKPRLPFIHAVNQVLTESVDVLTEKPNILFTGFVHGEGFFERKCFTSGEKQVCCFVLNFKLQENDTHGWKCNSASYSEQCDKYKRILGHWYSFNCVATPLVECDSYDYLGLVNRYVPLYFLAQKPFEYTSQAYKWRTTTNSSSVWRDLSIPSSATVHYLFTGDLTSMFFPSLNYYPFVQIHPRMKSIIPLAPKVRPLAPPPAPVLPHAASVSVTPVLPSPVQSQVRSPVELMSRSRQNAHALLMILMYALVK